MRRWKHGAYVAAALLAQAAPALAQYGAPFGSPGMLTVPEMANGALGAGAASTSASQPYCGTSGIGRDGPRGQCPENVPPPPPRGRR